ncbi:DUF4369 domain-containing protein [Flavobacterium gilvum]|uniref:Type IV secretion system putative lipoprotein virB7 n=1 Tax=Flavobacterium gilvum TaxID=1492737 RepID=A0AAC9I8P5_9FLAO|nr:DUF4369 domain-containing protein [Flavobacterium gilvum]AOW10232.1 thiol:disulfide interchange protein [Flavobacterium gilvum]KFC57923.1 thiol:disulfide interchange protein [Flavobacterium gilvum]
MKKIILFLTATALLTSCSKDKYTVSGVATGFENGKTVIMETQDEKGFGLIAVDTVKIENGKFEIKGKAVEPAFHTLQIEGVQGKIPFILENGDITIVVNKDTIQKSKVSGSYNNDEYVKFNEEMIKIQKPLMDFQTANMQKMQMAQQAKDTATINGLMKEYTKIQSEIGNASKTKYVDYANTHPKALISALIIQSMTNDPSVDSKKIETMYNGLDESLKNSKPGKAIKLKIAQLKIPTVGASAAPGAPATK